MRNGDRKLLAGEKVEVRSFEEGSKGSWHCGTVLSCGKGTRVVKYDHLLSDEDTSKKFVDVVRVSAKIDGIVSSDTSQSDYRGWIRPAPGREDFNKWALHYGLCVDMYYLDAWWEGVIFDHQDGSSVRSIFFPDIGDEMEAHKDDLRITHDWNEDTQKWKPRGDWLFLVLIEEIEKDWPLVVSVKQIWYDVRIKKEFNDIKEWTSSLIDKWRKLLLEVIVDNLRLTVKEFFDQLNSYGKISGEEFQLDEPTLDALLNNEAFFDDSLPINVNPDESVAIVRLDNAPISSSVEPTNEEPTCIIPCHDELCKGDSSTNNVDSLNNEHVWRSPDFVRKAEYCPDAIEEYCKLVREPKSKSNRAREAKLSEVRLSVWKHLLLIGWTVECRRSQSLTRMRRSRYIEPGPNGKCFHSLNKACEYLLGSGSYKLSLCTDLKTPKEMVLDNWDPSKLPEAESCEDAIFEYYNLSKHGDLPSEQLTLNALKHLRFLGWEIEYIQYERCWRYTHPNGSECFNSLFNVCDHLKKSITPIVAMPPQDEHNAITFLSPPSGLSQGCNDKLIQSATSDDEFVEYCAFDDTIPEPEYCHQALMNYYSRGMKEQGEKLKDMQVKAKKHLSAVGWKLYYYYKNNSRALKELRYSSPRGKLYYSLRSACKGYLDELINMGRQAEVELIGEGQKGQCSPLAIKEFHANQGEEQLINGKSYGQLLESQFSDPPKKERNQQDIQATNSRDNLHGPSSRVLRSSKIIRDVPYSSHSNPRTILSWLIDNDVVLPRAKVHYRSKRDGQKVAEGRVTREGIKCNCCQGVFTLSKFENHAMSAYHQPTANIYLEDGRSLLDCQMQLRRDVSASGSNRGPCEGKPKNRKKNDHLCSMCHSGGQLILCDRCPSSFHISCLGLKEVPDGDWFCPPCCCKICGQSETNMGLNVFIKCAQCELQYHIDCLRNKGHVLEGCPNGYWFCTSRCEQISSSLEKLLGKPIEVGVDNITWTLLKYTKPESRNDDSSIVVDSTEKYSKLNIALGVMHECFEPMSERRTEDLVEDVIFSRWSHLNRLNFRGFYTVLLEKNDELISTATVRIYGEKVAEIPLVATRFAYRRHGMCRILMNQLEKVLVELRVERLVLPAVPRIRKRHCGVTNGSDNINSVKGNKSRSRNDKDSLALLVRQPMGSECIVSQPEMNPERSVEGSDSTKEDERDGSVICYKRRRISKPGET